MQSYLEIAHKNIPIREGQNVYFAAGAVDISQNINSLISRNISQLTRSATTSISPLNRGIRSQISLPIGLKRYSLR